MCNEEDPLYPTPIGHQQLQVEVTCAMRRTHLPYPPIGHQQLRVEMTCAMRRTDLPYPLLVISSWELKWHVQWGGPTLPYPYWSSAVESWSDMCNEEDPPTQSPIGHQQLRVEMTWAMGEDPPYPTPIDHQQLRVIKWHVQWGRPALLLPYWSSAVESWNNMCNEEDTPYPIPHQSSAVESWSDVQWGGPTLPYPLLVISSWELK